MKRIIILNVRRHYGEIDWILPLLYLFKNFKIYTVFDNQLILDNFKKNEKLLIYGNINTNFYVKEKKKKFYLETFIILIY